MKLTKVTAIALAMALIASLITGCKNSAAESGTPPQAAPPPTAQPALQTDALRVNSLIYDAMKLDIPFDEYALEQSAEEPTRRQIYTFSNDRVYVERYSDIKDNGEVVGQVMGLISVDLVGENMRTVWSREVAFTPDALVRTFETVRGFTVDDNGGLWIMLEYETQDNTDELQPKTTIVNELFRYDSVGKLVGSTVIQELNESLTAHVMFRIVSDNDGNAYAGFTDEAEKTFAVYVFSAETGEYVCRNRSSTERYDMHRTRDGDVTYKYVANGKWTFGVLVLENGALAETAHAYNGRQNYATSFMGYGEHDVLFYDSLELMLYGYSFETGEEVKLIDFPASGIALPRLSTFRDGNYINDGSLIQLAEREFLISINPMGLFRLTPSNATPGDKTIVTVGLTYPDYLVTSAAAAFNAQSKTTYINIKDYSKGLLVDSSSAAAQLDLDIIRGVGPDIIDLTVVAPGKYINKNLLIDLTEYLDNDPKLRREDLFENVLELATHDGKLYHVITEFIVQTLAGKASNFGSGEDMSFGKLLEVMERYPNAILTDGYGAADWVVIVTMRMLDELVDWERGTCDFNTPEFAALLNSAKQLPTKTTFDMFEDMTDFQMQFEQYSLDIRNNDILLSFESLYTLRTMRDMMLAYGDNVTILGIPSLSGSESVLLPNISLGILETSNNKDKAWEFLSFIMQDEFESIYKMFTSINRNSFEKAAELEMTPLVDRDLSKMTFLRQTMGTKMYGVLIETLEQAQDPQYANYHLTEEEIAFERSMVEGTRRLAINDGQIQQIITEEVNIFISSERSVEETVRIIQSRAGVYIAENS